MLRQDARLRIGGVEDTYAQGSTSTAVSQMLKLDLLVDTHTICMINQIKLMHERSGKLGVLRGIK
jgi:hypothetical protein